MFVQIVQGSARDAGALRKQIESWLTDLAPGATGWLGTTGGITDDGRLIAVVRFESEQAGRANSERPEQDAWWRETSKHLENPEFHDSSRVATLLGGGSDDATFVQVIQAHTDDMERLRELAENLEAAMRENAPHVLGMTAIEHADRPGDYTQVVYFTSEEEARKAEREQPAEQSEAMQEMLRLVTDRRFFDLRNPWLLGPGSRASVS